MTHHFLQYILLKIGPKDYSDFIKKKQEEHNISQFTCQLAFLYNVVLYFCNKSFQDKTYIVILYCTIAQQGTTHCNGEIESQSCQILHGVATMVRRVFLQNGFLN